jgi:oligoendopeptidase F
MSQWQSRLDLKDLWKKRDEGSISIKELAQEVAKRIRKNKFYKKYEEVLEEIAIAFEDCEEDVEEFDNILNDLYDWADIPLDNNFGGKKICWISTRF